jgi:hypothetical protein
METGKNGIVTTNVLRQTSGDLMEFEIAIEDLEVLRGDRDRENWRRQNVDCETQSEMSDSKIC